MTTRQKAEPLTVRRVGDAVVARLNGPDFTSERLYDEVRHGLGRLVEEGCRQLWIDLETVRYVGGGALGALVYLWRQLRLAGGQFFVANVSPEFREILEIVRLNTIFEVRAGVLEEELIPPVDPTDEAFLETIRDEPEDDAVRLIYADWLDEQGQPERAEFIRLQIERARLPADSPQMPGMCAREREFLDCHGREWAGAVCPLVERYVFHRGFVEEVTLSWMGLAEHSRELAQRALVRRLRVRPTWGINPVPFAALVESPLLPRLAEIDLRGNRIEDEMMAVLARLPSVGRLSALLLERNTITDRGALDLARSRHLGQLVRVDLRGNTIGDFARQELRARFGDGVLL
jgi:anti-anti-sigma factor